MLSERKGHGGAAWRRTDTNMLNRSGDDTVCKTGKDSRNEQLTTREGLSSRTSYAVLNVLIGEDTLGVFERAELDGNTNTNAEERSERPLHMESALMCPKRVVVRPCRMQTVLRF